MYYEHKAYASWINKYGTKFVTVNETFIEQESQVQ